MAGILKPNNTREEANYKYIGGVGSSGLQPTGLFNGVSANEWNTNNVMYWNGAGTYVEIEVFEEFNLWRSGTTSWISYKNPLKILKYQASSATYVDVTSLYPQALTSINENQWEKTLSNIPKGRYRFEYDAGLRIDSEWFIESTGLKRILLLSGDGKAKAIVEGVTSPTSAIPKMTSDTAPSGKVFYQSQYTSYYARYAFDKLTVAQGYLSNGQTGYLGYEFPKSIVLSKYSLRSPSSAQYLNRMPRDWTFEGSNNGVDWITLDTRSNQSWGDVSLFKDYFFRNHKSYTQYRVCWTTNNGDINYTGIDELEMFELLSASGISLIPSHSGKDLINYGMHPPVKVNEIFAIKNYILQDVVSENSEGFLWTKLDRKPLSIGFN